MHALAHSHLLDLSRPKTLRLVAVLGLVIFSLFAGYAATQDGMKYPAAVALVVMMVLFRRWQEHYVLALSVLLFFMSALTIEFLAIKGTQYRWHGLLLVVGVGCLRRVNSNRWELSNRPLFLGMAAWCIYLVWSSTWAFDVSYSFPRAGAICLVLFAAFFTIYNYVESGWGGLNKTLVFLCWMYMFFLALQFLPGGTVTLDGRFNGMMNHVNALGTIVCLGIPLSLYLLLDAPIRRIDRVVAGIVFIEGWVLLLQCASRSALLAVLVVVTCYFALRNPIRLALTLASAAIFCLILMGYEVDLIETFNIELLIRPETLATGTNRTEAWEIALFFHKTRPIWGYGFFSGLFLVGGTVFVETARQLGFGHFHNSYLELLVDLGWVGTIPFLMFLSYLALLAVRRYRAYRRHTVYRRAVLGLGLVVLAGLIQATFESWLLQPGNVTTLLFWSLAACWLGVLLKPERFLEIPDTSGATAA